ncbi:ATP-binding cassette domain-containing protein [Cupriavidus alkaliphilus]|uniref:ABC-type multidrug transport system fused ATPase/permease subunit n=1 Tax=Cupriavidus alkaliphilus TaxID=942866 RepID=A0A7W4VB51_9BURK|nr:ABC transporter ATP-binding protein [Cupriavidus alkaliphilus]MBB3008366.1 ABC-type multidrug transport system fused ATPase/permease subunit [Cupriavidus alkaliphilus]
MREQGVRRLAELKSRQWKDLFLLSAAGWTLILILIHQGVIAASSYFLTRLIEAFQAGTDYRSYLFEYLLAMVLPYLPGCASLVALQAWINQAHRRFSARLPEAIFGHTGKHNDNALREATEAAYSRNSFAALKDYLTFVHQFATLCLNSVLSIVVLALLLPANLLEGYMVSVLASMTLILLLRPGVHSLSTKTETALISYGDALSQVWDNSVLGNRYNFELWNNYREQLASKYYRQSNKLQFLKQAGNLALALISLAPTTYLILVAVQSKSAEPILIAAIVVNLTRIFHILNSLSGLVNQILDFSAMNARIRVMMSPELKFDDPSHFPDKPRGEIYLNGAPIHEYKSVVEIVRSCSHGRFTIQGANGAGKSTLLQVLKQALSGDAILVPSHNGKLRWRATGIEKSTGERAVGHLLEISEHPDAKYLLLDEWDANLDAANTKAINDVLRNFSQHKVIVEIRH